MDSEVLDSLDDLRYDTKYDESSLKTLLGNTREFSKLLEWACKELKSCSSIDECVTTIDSDEDVGSFHVELSSLLKELGCPYKKLMTGSMEERFNGEKNRLLLLNFLLGELQAARITHVNSANNKQLKVELAESRTAQLLREMLQTLGVSKPPPGITAKNLVTRMSGSVTEILSKMPPGLIDKPFLVGNLSEKQWAQLEDLNNQFKQEYQLRREMLLKRLDVTIQSFHWSERLKNKTDEINKQFRQKRDLLGPVPLVSISDVLAARSDLAIIEKTSSAKVRQNTKSEINRVVIGKVPDRGGRPNEAQPPPPEMPPWQQRQSGGGQGWSASSQPQRDYGGNRGPRGGPQRPKVQGGWSDHGSNNYQQQNYQQQQQPQQYQQKPQYQQGGFQQGGYQTYSQDNGGGGYNNHGDTYSRDRGDSSYRGHGNQDGRGRNQGDYHQGGGYRGGGGGQRGRGGGGGYHGNRHNY